MTCHRAKLSSFPQSEYFYSRCPKLRKSYGTSASLTIVSNSDANNKQQHELRVRGDKSATNVTLVCNVASENSRKFRQRNFAQYYNCQHKNFTSNSDAILDCNFISSTVCRMASSANELTGFLLLLTQFVARLLQLRFVCVSAIFFLLNSFLVRLQWLPFLAPSLSLYLQKILLPTIYFSFRFHLLKIILKISKNIFPKNTLQQNIVK